MKNNNNKIGSNKSFGIIFAIFFLIVSLYPLTNAQDIRIWAAIISILFFILGLINSKILTPVNILWFKFGFLLGKIFSPIIMGIIFFFIVTPIGIIMRVFKKDLLNLKYNNKKSYWIEKTGPKSKMKNQF
tara:strand:- start:421 stop:810 length:390 start_codon:yes stop_codon:yes gene_type:complete